MNLANPIVQALPAGLDYIVSLFKDQWRER